MKTVHENLKTLLSKHFGSSSRIPDSISDFLNDINDDYFRFIGQQNRTAAEIRNQPLRNPFLDAVELSFDPVFIMTKNGLLSYISPAVERLTEFSREELMNNHLAVMFPKSEIDVAHEILSAAEKGRHIRGLKTRLRKKNGGDFLIEVYATPLTMDSAPDGLICVARDISSQMKIQESLVKSEERFRSMIEYGSDVITIIGLDGTIYYESPSVERVLGYRPEEVIGKNAFEFLHPDDMPAIISGINRLMENDSIAISSDLRIMSAAGDYKVVEATGVNQIKNPAVNGIIITYRDVTEHRRSIQKLTESEERYRTLVEMANDGIAIIKNGNIVYANRGFNTITGFSQEEMKNQPIFSFMFEDDISRLIELRREHKKRPAAPSIFESSLKDRNGSRVHVEVNVSSIPYGGGRADMVVFRDISKRKLAEAKLFESEKRYRMLAENMSDVVWIMDIRSLMLTYASPSVKEMLGYEVEEILQMPLSGYVAEEYIEPIMKDLAEELDRESREETAEIDPNRNRNIDIKYRHKNGTPVWAEIRAKFLRDADGHPDRIMGVSRDISARKLAEKKLRESEERLRLIIETSTDIIYVLNPEGKFTYISPRFEEVTGHPVDEILGRNFTDFLPPDQIRPLDATFESGMRQRISNIYECTMVFPNGDSIPVELNVNSICDTTGKIVGRLGVARDIRGRRETEWALRESELRYRLLAENSSDVIWTMDLSLHFTYVSPSNQVIFGYTPEETMRKNLDELLTPESYRLAVAYFKKEITLYARGLDADPFRKRTLELQQLTKDGRTLDIEVNISLINDGTGRAIGILGITRDVTARKRAENALKESEERLRLRNEVIEKDLKTAQLIQRSLISGKTLRSERLDVDVRYLPLDAVGGDYFSFTELENEGLGVFIGDVTSHGVTAALYLSLIKATTDRICRIHALDPAEYITELNRELFNNMPLSFLTAIYGIFLPDPADNTMRFAFSCAGHPPPLLYRADTGTVDFIAARGPIIGMLPSINCEKITITPKKWDRIYLYTDGLPETQNGNKELIELDRLPDLIRAATRPSLSETLDAITDATNAFRGGVRFTDDIVLIGFEIK